MFSIRTLRQLRRLPRLSLAVAMVGAPAIVLAQPKGSVMANGNHPVFQQPQLALTAYLRSLTVSVNGSAPATQATGPANPHYESSPPNASASVGATLNWTALPATPAQPVSGPKLAGYVVLRASTTRPGGWDSVAFVAAPPAQVQALISPAANALFRVGAHYTSLTFSVSPNPNNSNQVVTGTNATHQEWTADTTAAVRVITP